MKAVTRLNCSERRKGSIHVRITCCIRPEKEYSCPRERPNGINHEHAIAEICSPEAERGQDARVRAWAEARFPHRVHHAMAKVARHAVAVGRHPAAAVGGHGAAALPAAREV